MVTVLTKNYLDMLVQIKYLGMFWTDMMSNKNGSTSRDSYHSEGNNSKVHVKPCVAYRTRARSDWILAIEVISNCLVTYAANPICSYQRSRLYKHDSVSHFIDTVHSNRNLTNRKHYRDRKEPWTYKMKTEMRWLTKWNGRDGMGQMGEVRHSLCDTNWKERQTESEGEGSKGRWEGEWAMKLVVFLCSDAFKLGEDKLQSN